MVHLISRSYSPIKNRREVHEKPFIIQALTMIEPETGWISIVQYKVHGQLK